jgi:peptidoglycan/xylan/chitin deacetylase (PgdA/CDA1 family)
MRISNSHRSSNNEESLTGPDYYMRFITVFEQWDQEIKRGIPILLLHKIGPSPARTNLPWMYVSPSAFPKQMSALKLSGFRTISIDQAISLDQRGSSQVVITFDDGFEGVFLHAGAFLRDLGFRAIQFLVADRLGQLNQWDFGIDTTPERLMDRVQVNDWLSLGHEIGAHTLTHPRLTEISREKAREEISSSKKKLEDLFGVPIRHFAYPYGSHNQETMNLVREAGLETACSAEQGVVLPGENVFGLKRLSVIEKRLPRWLAYKAKRHGMRLMNWSRHFADRFLAP